MNPSTPQISVIIPVYNHAKYLPEAIESVLNQSLTPLEVIVVDDGSDDDSHLSAQSFGPSVRVLRQEHLGISAARNLGIRHAEGDFIALCDADDLFDPEKLAKQYGLFTDDPQLQLAFCRVQQFLSPDIPPEDSGKYRCPDEAIAGGIPGALMATRQAFEQVGEFDPAIQVGEFLDWYGRAKLIGLKEQCHPEVLYRRRIHGENHGIRTKDAKQQYLKVLKANLDRRRKMGHS